MGKLKVRFGLIGATAAILAVGLASAAQAEDLSGEFIVVDGPLAGTTLVADASGKVSKKGERHGFIRAPDADCPYLHFQGVEGGKDEKKINIKETDCLRVTRRIYAQDVLQNVSDALEAEENGKLDQAIHHLKLALWDLDSSATGDEKTLDGMKKKVRKARDADKDAQDARKDGDKKKAEALLDKADRLKHQTLDGAPLDVKLYLPPTLTPIDAQFQPANTQTVYTMNITPRPGSVVKYIWSFVELNDPSCVFFEPNKPAANQATWHHGDAQGCNHGLEGSNGHQGVIGVTVYDTYYICGASYTGSNTGTGPAPGPCKGAYG